MSASIPRGGGEDGASADAGVRFAPRNEGTTTLPLWLCRQSEVNGDQLALRHKLGGIWHPLNWREVEDRVRRLAQSLAGRGFGPGDALLVLTGHPSPDAVFLTLAAQWLGGFVIPTDPVLHTTGMTAAIGGMSPRFAFVEGHAQVRALRRAVAGRYAMGAVVYADGRALIHDDASDLVSYETLLAGERGKHPRADPGGDRVAFVFPRANASGGAGPQEDIVTITHDELLAVGRHVVTAERLTQDDEGLVSRGFATSAHARYVLAPWLVGGFRLNFPETISTRDTDRRELGPTLVIGTAETYARLVRRAQEKLPPAQSLRRRFIDWALRPGGGLLSAVFGHWLVRRPLKDVLGLTRVAAPLVVGEPLDSQTAAFLARIGVNVRAWPDPATVRAMETRQSIAHDATVSAHSQAAVPA